MTSADLPDSFAQAATASWTAFSSASPEAPMRTRRPSLLPPAEPPSEEPEESKP